MSPIWRRSALSECLVKLLFAVIKVNETLRCCLVVEEVGVETVNGNKTTSRRAEEGQTIGNETWHQEDAEVLDGPKSPMTNDSNNLYDIYDVDRLTSRRTFSPGTPEQSEKVQLIVEK